MKNRAVVLLLLLFGVMNGVKAQEVMPDDVQKLRYSWFAADLNSCALWSEGKSETTNWFRCKLLAYKRY